MTNEDMAKILINGFRVKFQQDGKKIAEGKDIAFFADVALAKFNRVGIYGFVEYEDGTTIGNSIDRELKPGEDWLTENVSLLNECYQEYYRR